MYYLQTRYYAPVVRRFINADMPELAGGGTFLGLNLFAYCTNNPVMNMDEESCLSNGWKIAITAGLLVAATAVIIATGGVAVRSCHVCGNQCGTGRCNRRCVWCGNWCGYWCNYNRQLEGRRKNRSFWR